MNCHGVRRVLSIASLSATDFSKCIMSFCTLFGVVIRDRVSTNNAYDFQGVHIGFCYVYLRQSC